MPVFFQHQESNCRLLLWNAAEEEAFFSEDLVGVLTDGSPAHPEKRKQYLAGRFLLRQLDPHFPLDRIHRTPKGRPYLPDTRSHFSLSHAGSYIAAILNDTEKVGIDVERINDRAHRIRTKFLSAKEEGILLGCRDDSQGPSANHLYTMAWSVKEAAFKALHQTGVDFIRDLPIEQIDVVEGGWSIKIGGKGMGLYVRAMIFEPICLAWAVQE